MRPGWYGRAPGRGDSERIPISLMNRDAWPGEFLLSLPLRTGGDTQPRSVRGAAMFTEGEKPRLAGARAASTMPRVDAGGTRRHLQSCPARSNTPDGCPCFLKGERSWAAGAERSRRQQGVPRAPAVPTEGWAASSAALLLLAARGAGGPGPCSRDFPPTSKHQSPVC